MANTPNYKITLNKLEKMNSFIPDLSFNNDIIIEEINKFEKNLYNIIYILDIGEQKFMGFKFGDLLLVNHKLKHYYNTIHLSLNYENSKYIINYLKNLDQKIFDLNSFNDYYIELRNYIYGTTNSEDENEINEVRKIVLKIKNYLDSEDSKIKYKILDWRLKCVKCDTNLPIAANKNSK